MIVPEGWPLVLTPACLGVAAVALGWPAAGWLLTGFAALCLLVFRNPPRTSDAAPDVACAPADGIVESFGPARDGSEVRIVLRIPPFAPQVTRMPVSGTLETVSRESAAGVLLRECVTSAWGTRHGRVVLRQIAGRFARRVVFDHEVGETAERTARVGVLRFGSRVEVELPAGTVPLVTVGDRVRAGSSSLARMAS